jgi:hypothetical protein
MLLDHRSTFSVRDINIFRPNRYFLMDQTIDANLCGGVDHNPIRVRKKQSST